MLSMFKEVRLIELALRLACLLCLCIMIHRQRYDTSLPQALGCQNNLLLSHPSLSPNPRDTHTNTFLKVVTSTWYCFHRSFQTFPSGETWRLPTILFSSACSPTVSAAVWYTTQLCEAPLSSKLVQLSVSWTTKPSFAWLLVVVFVVGDGHPSVFFSSTHLRWAPRTTCLGVSFPRPCQTANEG